MESATRTPFQLGPYNCVERVGAGPLGEIFRAKLYRLGGMEEQFAIVRLHPLLAGEARLIVRIEAAVRAQARLDDERIARVLKLVQEGGEPYLVAEFVHGLDLRQVVEGLAARGETMATEHAAAIVAEAARAMAFAHDHTELIVEGVVHAGLAPDQVMLTQAGGVKVLHPGLARAALSHPGWLADPTMEERRRYLAPEQLAGEPPGRASDVWSLGAILWELASGAPPYWGSSAEELQQACEAPPKEGPRPMEPALLAIARRCLEAQPEARLGGAAELQAALDTWLGDGRDAAMRGMTGLARRLVVKPRSTQVMMAVQMPPPEPPRRTTQMMAVVSPDGGTVERPTRQSSPSLPWLPPLRGAPRPDAPHSGPAVAAAEPSGEHAAQVAPADPHAPAPAEPQAAPNPLSSVPPTSHMPPPIPDDAPRSRSSAPPPPDEDLTAGWTLDDTPVPVDQQLPPGAADAFAQALVSSGETNPAPAVPSTAGAPEPVDAPGISAAAIPPAEAPADPAPPPAPSEGAVIGRLQLISTRRLAVPPELGGPSKEMELIVEMDADPDEVTPLPQPLPSTDPAPLEGAHPHLRLVPPSLADAPPVLADAPPVEPPQAPPLAAPPASAPPVEPLPLPPPPPGPPRVSTPRRSRPPPSRVRPLAFAVAVAAVGVVGLIVYQLLTPPPSLDNPEQAAERRREQLRQLQIQPRPIAEERPSVAPERPPRPVSAPEKPREQQELPISAPATRVSPRELLVTAPGKPVSHPEQPVSAPGKPLSHPEQPVSAPGKPLSRQDQPVSAPGKPPVRQELPPSRPAVPVEHPAAPVAVAVAGQVAVRSEPVGAMLFVDGQPAGNTPSLVALTPGHHALVLLAEGYAVWHGSIDPASATVDARLTATRLPASAGVGGGLKVRCLKHPGEDRVLVDGADSGRACPNEVRIELAPGPHKIGIYSPRDGKTVEIEREIAPGDASTRVYLHNL